MGDPEIELTGLALDELEVIENNRIVRPLSKDSQDSSKDSSNKNTHDKGDSL
jgi:hypothetical protein